MNLSRRHLSSNAAISALMTPAFNSLRLSKKTQCALDLRGFLPRLPVMETAGSHSQPDRGGWGRSLHRAYATCPVCFRTLGYSYRHVQTSIGAHNHQPPLRRLLLPEYIPSRDEFRKVDILPPISKNHSST